MKATAAIRKLIIKRFRGLAAFEWCPAPGVNLILGGGDVGKSTVLEAIALLLNPSNAAVVSESDYWRRDSTQEFVIEAVMSLPESTGISSQHNFSWPWAWDGKDAVVPSASEGDDLPVPEDPVYRVRVRGTTELELVWEIVRIRPRIPVVASAPDFVEDRMRSGSEVCRSADAWRRRRRSGIACATMDYRRGASRASQ